MTWNRKVCQIMAFWALFKSLGHSLAYVLNPVKSKCKASFATRG